MVIPSANRIPIAICTFWQISKIIDLVFKSYLYIVGNTAHDMLWQKANLRTKNETIKKSNWDDQRGERKSSFEDQL